MGRAKRFQGMTLIELLIGLGLFSVIALVLVQAITWGLRAHRKGEAARQAQAFSREAVQRMTDEVSTGVALDTLYSSNTHPHDFFSAVVWPDSYESRSTEFTEPVYARDRFTRDGVEIDRVKNRVILTRPATSINDAAFNDRDYSQFVYVEYVVPPPTADGRGQHVLLRRVYRVATIPSGPPAGNDSTIGTFTRYINPTFFAINTYDPGAPLAIFANPNTTVASLTPVQQQAQTVVLELPQDTDRIEFTVEHPRNRESATITDAGVAASLPYFDATLFTINVTVSIGLQQLPDKFFATRSLSSQARVKSGS